MAIFKDQVQKEGGGKKNKGDFSLAQYIYLSNVIVSLLVSQIVASKKYLLFYLLSKKKMLKNI